MIYFVAHWDETWRSTVWFALNFVSMGAPLFVILALGKVQR